MTLFDRRVSMPVSDSFRQLKIGERAIPSILFSSRDVLRNTLLTRRKYHTSGGRKTAMSGRIDKADTNAPMTMKSITKKSNWSEKYCEFLSEAIKRSIL